MEILGNIISVIFGLIFILALIGSPIAHILVPIWRKYKYKKASTQTLTAEPAQAKTLHETLIYYSNYYRHLSDGDKTWFLFRVHTTLTMLKVAPRERLVLTPEMPILVAASWVQFTFGLKNYSLYKFKAVFLYPDAFLSPFLRMRVHGETHVRGLIAMSWPTLRKSFTQEDDNRHLGIHEMAHALRIIVSKRYTGDYGFSEAFDEWEKYAYPVFRKIREDKNHYLRFYGAISIEEFFAVSVEHFFETPELFRQHELALFEATAELLNQNFSGNGRFERGQYREVEN